MQHGAAAADGVDVARAAADDGGEPHAGVRAVLGETVRHYRDVTGVTFWIGDKLIGDLIAIIDR